jgi:hypothetical protein
MILPGWPRLVLLTTKYKAIPHMTTEQVTLCGRIKRLGYSRGNQVELYGERFDLISDPFCVGDNSVLVDALEQRSGCTRRVRIPLNIVRAAEEQDRAA